MYLSGYLMPSKAQPYGPHGLRVLTLVYSCDWLQLPSPISQESHFRGLGLLMENTRSHKVGLTKHL